MALHTFLKVSPRIVKKFIINYLGFNKENDYIDVKVKKLSIGVFSVRAFLFPFSEKSIDPLSDDYEYFCFVSYKDAFSFKNIYEGYDLNANGEKDKLWQEFINSEKNSVLFPFRIWSKN